MLHTDFKERCKTSGKASDLTQKVFGLVFINFSLVDHLL